LVLGDVWTGALGSLLILNRAELGLAMKNVMEYAIEWIIAVGPVLLG